MAGGRTTLISEQTLTPYSGMLPGFVAGHYSHLQTHIDLNRLCQWAGVHWIKARITGIDAATKTVVLQGRDKFHYDKLSVDTGSTPDLSVPGAKEYAVGVKPVSGFAEVLQQLLSEQQHSHGQRWGVVGAGAGGVELILALAHRLRAWQLDLHLITNSNQILPTYPPRLRDSVEQALAEYSITVHRNFPVDRVEPDGVRSGENALALDKSIWCTGASAPRWLADSDLATGERGFIAVNRFLQSTSHSEVFAAGDVADMVDDPRPKAGVYAVRQAPFLTENLRRSFAGRAMKQVDLQNDFLSLLSLGAKEAVGCRFGVVAAGSWVWKLKDWIDQRFMDRLNDPGPKPAMPPVATETMFCAGCGSKLGPQLVADNLRDLPVYQRDAIEPALSVAEDASVWTVPAPSIVLQSIDGFRSFSNDLELLGDICVNHALSDLYAMGILPVMAQVWINLAHAHPRLQRRDHRRLMAGIARALVREQTTLAGGHSTEGAETHVAIFASGDSSDGSDRLWRKNRPRAGQALVLTKPLGTGVILAADMQAVAPAVAVDAAFASMLQSNRSAALALREYSPAAVTDVTGFGLLGHLLEMLQGSALGAQIRLADVPSLDGALDLSDNGIRSTLYPQLTGYLNQCHMERSAKDAQVDLLLDPQTSGGLLIALDPQQANAFSTATGAAVIGEITDGNGVEISAN